MATIDLVTNVVGVQELYGLKRGFSREMSIVLHAKRFIGSSIDQFGKIVVRKVDRSSAPADELNWGCQNYYVISSAISGKFGLTCPPTQSQLSDREVLDEHTVTGKRNYGKLSVVKRRWRKKRSKVLFGTSKKVSSTDQSQFDRVRTIKYHRLYFTKRIFGYTGKVVSKQGVTRKFMFVH
jgi:hypothetical protein